MRTKDQPPQEEIKEKAAEETPVEAKELDMETRAKILAVAVYEMYRYSHKRFNEVKRLGATVVQKQTALQDLNRIFGAAKTALETSGVEINGAQELRDSVKNPLIIT